MVRREKIGLSILIALLVSLGIIMAITTKRPTSPGRGFNDNVIVEQRVRNLRNR